MIAANLTFSQTEPDSSQTVQNDEMTFQMTKSPMGAVLRSAILPGWGQVYNESYWKIPIVWGTLGFIAYGYYFYHVRYVKFRDKYSDAVINNDPLEDQYLNTREWYKDNRDQMAVYFGLAYALNLLDAYVDAHLFDFDVSENSFTHKPQLNIRIRF